MDDIVNMANIVDENEYQVDLNNDGDMNDIIQYSSPNSDYYFSPGRPWWAQNNKTLDDVFKYIQLHWYKDKTYIYGTVYKIEFYVKKSQADKMIEWWEDRYKHLKVYSVEPWIGEQCTTTVKEALAHGGIDDIDWNTLTPDGILQDLKTEIKSTSTQHKDQKAKISRIKKEAKDWKP